MTVLLYCSSLPRRTFFKMHCTQFINLLVIFRCSVIYIYMFWLIFSSGNRCSGACTKQVFVSSYITALINSCSLKTLKPCYTIKERSDNLSLGAFYNYELCTRRTTQEL